MNEIAVGKAIRLTEQSIAVSWENVGYAATQVCDALGIRDDEALVLAAAQFCPECRQSGGFKQPFKPVRSAPPGVYAIYGLRAREWMYVGQSVSLYIRLHQHFQDYPGGLSSRMLDADVDFDILDTAAICIPILAGADRTRAERRLIAELTPKWNVH